MVYCRKLKDGKCDYTGGRCFLKNPKTIEDYKICQHRQLAKDYSEMTIEEKAFENSISNKEKISELKKEFDYLYDDFVDLKTRISILGNKEVKKEETRWQRWKKLISLNG